jgi:4'-phosphopantetheinyl transferase EntD
MMPVMSCAPSGKRKRGSAKLGGMNCLASNPAQLSAALSSLFPAGAVAAELREPGNPALLIPAEARHLGRAVPKRINEFAAGRLCARRALAEFGIVDFAVEVAGDRQPIWPASMVGSITHTAGFCAAAVAERGVVGALGLDSEVVGDVKAEIWPSVYLPSEIDWIRSLPASQQAAAVTLLFSAKEAFYKCQYPVTHERLDFLDVRVEASWSASDGVFTVHANRRIAMSTRTAMPIQGQYLFHQEFVTAGLGVAAAEFVQYALSSRKTLSAVSKMILRSSIGDHRLR